MATVAIMVGGAILNAATFIGGNYLAKALSGDSGQAALQCFNERCSHLVCAATGLSQINKYTHGCQTIKDLLQP